MNENEEEWRATVEADIAFLKEQVKTNRFELGANTRGSLVFAGGIVVTLLLGSRFSHAEGYSYSIELEKLTTLIGLPAMAGLLSALLPIRK